MANLSITAASVVAQAGATIKHGVAATIAGAPITAGMPLRLASDGRLVRAGAAGGNEENAQVAGIALSAASNNQPVSYCTAGDINLGATLTVGMLYRLSASGTGAIAPAADIINTDEWVTDLGVAKSASILSLDIQIGGLQIA